MATNLAATLTAASLAIASCTSSPPAPTSSASSTLAPHPTTRETVPTQPAAALTVQEGSFEWRQLPIGAGGFMAGIVSSPAGNGAVYARSDVGGAYRWDAADARWVQMITASSVPEPEVDNGDYNVHSIAVSASDPDRVVVATGNDYTPGSDDDVPRTGRILVSDNGGTTWRTSPRRWFISGNQSSTTGNERLAVDPADPDHIVFGSPRDGLWQSSDGGTTWEQVPDTMVPSGQSDDRSADQQGVSTVGFVGSTLVAGVANRGVYASADGGTTWRQISTIDTAEYPAGAVAVDGTLWIAILGTSDRDAYVTTWDPSTGEWSGVATPTDGNFVAFAVDPTDRRHVVLTDAAVRDGHLWTSLDGGRTWTAHEVTISSPDVPWLEQTNLDDYMSTGRLMFDPSGNGTVWFAEGFSVWRSDDIDAPDVTWVAAASGLELTVTSTMVVEPDGTPVAATADSQGFRFDDGLEYPAHTLIDRTFVGGTSLDASGGHPEVLAWVGAEYQIYYDDARRARGAVSADGGVTWRQFEDIPKEMFGGEVAVSATDPAVMVWVPTSFANPFEFLAEPKGVYSSRDAGHTWQHLSDVGGANSFHRFLWWFTRRALAADRVNGNFYLMSDEGRFFVSTDDAVSWTEARNAPPCLDVNACHVFGQVQAQPGTAGRTWASVGDGGFYRSDDAGATPWKRLRGIDEARAFTFGAPLTPGRPLAVYVYGRANGEATLGLYLSVDDGATWTRVSTFPAQLHAPVTSVTGDLGHPGRVYVGFSGLGYVRGDLSTAG